MRGLGHWAAPTALIAGLAPALIWLLFFWVPERPIGPGHRLLAESAEPRGGDFRLQSSGGPVDTAQFRGKVIALYFGYTWCPDICPTSLAFLSSALNALAPQELKRVQGLFVSVDPARDDFARLDRYTDYFHPQILGLTGETERLAEIAATFGAAFRRADVKSATDYAVDHTADTYIIDVDGRLHARLAHGTDPEIIVGVLRELLAHGSEGRGSSSKRQTAESHQWVVSADVAGDDKSTLGRGKP